MADADTSSHLALNTADTFIDKWQGVTASELSTSQSFLIDLCHLLGVDTPHPTAELDYMFERPITFSHGDAPEVFAGLTFEVEDIRRDYGETRVICFGHLAGRMVVIGYTPRGAVRHIFSMRKANEREQARIGQHLEV